MAGGATSPAGLGPRGGEAREGGAGLGLGGDGVVAATEPESRGTHCLGLLDLHFGEAA